jgi:integrase
MIVYMKIQSQIIDKYLESKKLAWSPSTLRSESARLRALREALVDGSPAKLWEAMERSGMAPYSRCTTWTRVVQLVDWAAGAGLLRLPGGVNPFKTWRNENARLFKNAYVRQHPELTFEDAEKRVRALRPDVARRALEILYSALRYAESDTHDGKSVVGKGGLERKVYVPEVGGPAYELSYSTFVRHLKAAGLKPHDLRKLAAMRIVEQGANEFELCEIMGWTSLAPAMSYIKANKSRVQALMQGLRKAG